MSYYDGTYCAGNYTEICDFCGTKFKVNVPGQEGHMDQEEYQCPSCGKIFTTRASLTPSVTLISGRTDGKDEMYDNKRTI